MSKAPKRDSKIETDPTARDAVCKAQRGKAPKLGGRAQRMRPAVEFAQQNGFKVEFTKGRHLNFLGNGGRVIGAGTPRSGWAALRAISRMKALCRRDPYG